MSRDPIGEKGGKNLYGFVGNNVPNLVDRIGLSPKKSNWSGLVLATTAMKILIDREMNSAFPSEVCPKGLGVHAIFDSGQVYFSRQDGVLVSALLSTSGWNCGGMGTVREDRSVDSCKIYDIQTKWTFWDDIDCNDFQQLRDKGYFDPGMPWWGDLLGYMEGACEWIGLNRLISVHVEFDWSEYSAGSCAK